MYQNWSDYNAETEGSATAHNASSKYDSNWVDSSKPWSPIYKPLPEGDYLRILIVKPGNYEDDIECELKVQTHRRSKNTYAAISYVWGDPADTIDVTCEGCPVRVTRSLGDALRQFRHPRTIRKLWADALCINQRDVAEKSTQVRGMGKVYRNARKVLVWLGPDQQDMAQDCFRMIEKTNQYLDALFLRHDRVYTSMPRLVAPYPIPVDWESWSSVSTLVRLPWFERAWTVQECALAKVCYIFWGSHSINIADVFEISLWARRYVDLSVILSSHNLGHCDALLPDFQHIHCYYGDGPRWQCSRPALSYEAGEWSSSSFAGVLYAGGALKATDPRDHIFAFLECPLAKGKDGRSIVRAEYSMSVEEVRYEVACTLLRHPKEGPWVLSAVKHRKRRDIVDSQRPSWIPCWNTRNVLPLLANPVSCHEAGGCANMFRAIPRRGKTLEITGFHFDEVVWRSVPFKYNAFSMQRFENSETHLVHEPVIERTWREASLAAEGFGFTLDEEAFTLTLIEEEPLTIKWRERCRDCFRAYCEVVRAEYRAPTLLSAQSTADETLISKAFECMNNLTLTTFKKSLFLTRGGRIGIASGAITEVGDLCCIFSGVSVPFLLTPAANRWHKLVDECFIYGVMNGQLLDEYEAGPILLE